MARALTAAQRTIPLLEPTMPAEQENRNVAEVRDDGPRVYPVVVTRTGVGFLSMTSRHLRFAGRQVTLCGVDIPRPPGGASSRNCQACWVEAARERAVIEQ